MVREDGAPGEAGTRRTARRRDPHSPGALGRRLRPLAREYSGLEHLAAALVGTSHTGLVLQGLRSAVRHAREPDGSRGVSAMRWRRETRRRRPGHLVLIVALADLDARVAEREGQGLPRV